MTGATGGNNYQKILLTLWVVKVQIAFENGPGFQAEIEDLNLKCCIPGDGSKNKTSRKDSPNYQRKNPPSLECKGSPTTIHFWVGLGREYY